MIVIDTHTLQQKEEDCQDEISEQVKADVKQIIHRLSLQHKLKDQEEWEQFVNPKRFMLEIDHYMIGTPPDEETYQEIESMQRRQRIAVNVLSFGMVQVIKTFYWM